MEKVSTKLDTEVEDINRQMEKERIEKVPTKVDTKIEDMNRQMGKERIEKVPTKPDTEVEDINRQMEKERIEKVPTKPDTEVEDINRQMEKERIEKVPTKPDTEVEDINRQMEKERIEKVPTKPDTEVEDINRQMEKERIEKVPTKPDTEVEDINRQMEKECIEKVPTKIDKKARDADCEAEDSKRQGEKDELESKAVKTDEDVEDIDRQQKKEMIDLLATESVDEADSVHMKEKEFEIDNKKYENEVKENNTPREQNNMVKSDKEYDHEAEKRKNLKKPKETEMVQMDGKYELDNIDSQTVEGKYLKSTKEKMDEKETFAYDENNFREKINKFENVTAPCVREGVEGMQKIEKSEDCKKLGNAEESVHPDSDVLKRHKTDIESVVEINNRLSNDNQNQLESSNTEISSSAPPSKTTSHNSVGLKSNTDRVIITLKHQNQIFFCVTCKFSTKTQKGFEEHVATHIMAKPYICINCMTRFGSKSDTLEHGTTVHPDKPIKCAFQVKNLNQIISKLSQDGSYTFKGIAKKASSEINSVVTSSLSGTPDQCVDEICRSNICKDMERTLNVAVNSVLETEEIKDDEKHQNVVGNKVDPDSKLLKIKNFDTESVKELDRRDWHKKQLESVTLNSVSDVNHEEIQQIIAAESVQELGGRNDKEKKDEDIVISANCALPAKSVPETDKCSSNENEDAIGVMTTQMFLNNDNEVTMETMPSQDTVEVNYSNRHPNVNVDGSNDSTLLTENGNFVSIEKEDLNTYSEKRNSGKQTVMASKNGYHDDMTDGVTSEKQVIMNIVTTSTECLDKEKPETITLSAIETIGNESSEEQNEQINTQSVDKEKGKNPAKDCKASSVYKASAVAKHHNAANEGIKQIENSEENKNRDDKIKTFQTLLPVSSCTDNPSSVALTKDTLQNKNSTDLNGSEGISSSSTEPCNSVLTKHQNQMLSVTCNFSSKKLKVCKEHIATHIAKPFNLEHGTYVHLDKQNKCDLEAKPALEINTVNSYSSAGASNLLPPSSHPLNTQPSSLSCTMSEKDNTKTPSTQEERMCAENNFVIPSKVNMTLKHCLKKILRKRDQQKRLCSKFKKHSSHPGGLNSNTKVVEGSTRDMVGSNSFRDLNTETLTRSQNENSLTMPERSCEKTTQVLDLDVDEVVGTKEASLTNKQSTENCTDTTTDKTACSSSVFRKRSLSNSTEGSKNSVKRKGLFARVGSLFVCKPCKIETDQQLVFTEHIWHHLHVKKKVCKKCPQNLGPCNIKCKIVSNILNGLKFGSASNLHLKEKKKEHQPVVTLEDEEYEHEKEDTVYHCGYQDCEFLCRSFTNMLEHVSTKHKQEEKELCHLCGNFSTEYIISGLSCIYCNIFVIENEIQNHVSESHLGMPKKVRVVFQPFCKSCNFKLFKSDHFSKRPTGNPKFDNQTTKSPTVELAIAEDHHPQGKVKPKTINAESLSFGSATTRYDWPQHIEKPHNHVAESRSVSSTTVNDSLSQSTGKFSCNNTKSRCDSSAIAKDSHSYCIDNPTSNQPESSFFGLANAHKNKPQCVEKPPGNAKESVPFKSRTMLNKQQHYVGKSLGNILSAQHFECKGNNCKYQSDTVQNVRFHILKYHKHQALHCSFCKRMETVMHSCESVVQLIQCPHCSLESLTMRTVIKHVTASHLGKPKSVRIITKLVCKAEHDFLKKREEGKKCKFYRKPVKQVSNKKVLVPDSSKVMSPCPKSKQTSNKKLPIQNAMHGMESQTYKDKRVVSAVTPNTQRKTSDLNVESNSCIVDIQSSKDCTKHPVAKTKSKAEHSKNEEKDNTSAKQIHDKCNEISFHIGADNMHQELQSCITELKELPDSYCCRICGNVTSSKYKTHKHLLKHMNIWIYRCGYCNYRVLETSKLYKHIKKSHNTVQFKHTQICRSELIGTIKRRIMRVNTKLSKVKAGASIKQPMDGDCRVKKLKSFLDTLKGNVSSSGDKEIVKESSEIIIIEDEDSQKEPEDKDTENNPRKHKLDADVEKGESPLSHGDEDGTEDKEPETENGENVSRDTAASEHGTHLEDKVIFIDDSEQETSLYDECVLDNSENESESKSKDSLEKHREQESEIDYYDEEITLKNPVTRTKRNQGPEIENIISERDKQISLSTGSKSVYQQSCSITRKQNDRAKAIQLGNIFKCSVCGYKSSNQSEVCRHLHLHKKNFTCSLCSFRTNQNSALQRHLIEIHHEKYAENKYNKMKRLNIARKHTKTRKQTSTFSNSKVNASTNPCKAADKHKGKSKHGFLSYSKQNMSRIFCIQCGFVAKGTKAFQVHCNYHHKTQVFSCAWCTQFSSTSILHLKTHTKHCHRNKMNMKFYIRQKKEKILSDSIEPGTLCYSSLKNPETIVCKECGDIRLNMKQFYFHCYNKHHGKLLLCAYCQQFKGKTTLKLVRHTKEVHGLRSLKFFLVDSLHQEVKQSYESTEDEHCQSDCWYNCHLCSYSTNDIHFFCRHLVCHETFTHITLGKRITSPWIHNLPTDNVTAKSIFLCSYCDRHEKHLIPMKHHIEQFHPPHVLDYTRVIPGKSCAREAIVNLRPRLVVKNICEAKVRMSASRLYGNCKREVKDKFYSSDKCNFAGHRSVSTETVYQMQPKVLIEDISRIDVKRLETVMEQQGIKIVLPVQSENLLNIKDLGKDFTPQKQQNMDDEGVGSSESGDTQKGDGLKRKREPNSEFTKSKFMKFPPYEEKRLKTMNVT